MLVVLALTLPLGALVQPLLWPSRSALPAVEQRVHAPLLLVSVAGLRADRVHHLGYPRPTTPNLDRLAHEGTTFPRFWAASDDPVASAASLQFAQPASRSGVYGAGDTPRGDPLSLAGLLRRRAPHHTLAILGDPAVAGPARVADFHEVLTLPGHPRAADLLSLAREALATHPDVFVWVDLVDLVPPWEPGQGDPRRFAPEMSDELATLGGPLAAAEAVARGWGARERAWLSDRYDAALAELDAELGRLLDDLERSMLLENMTVCVVGSSGLLIDERTDVALATGVDLYPASLRVPCVIRMPGQAVRGRVVGEPSWTLDVAPTLAELTLKTLRENDWPDLCGRPLLDVLTGARRIGNRTLVSEGPHRFRSGARSVPRAAAVFAGNYELLSLPGASPRYQLFNVDEDPRAERDLAEAMPTVTRELARRLDGWPADCGR